MELLGPFYRKRGTAVIQLGLWLEARHCDENGLVHDGVLATLADVALGRSLVESRNCQQSVVTVSLNLERVAELTANHWVEALVSIKQGEGEIGHCQCEVRSDEQLLMVVNGTFKYINQRYYP